MSKSLSRSTAPLRRLFGRPLRRVAAVIDRRADDVLTTILRRELARPDLHIPVRDELLAAVLRLEQAREESDRRGEERLAAVLRLEQAREESDRRNDLILDALIREVIRLQQLVEELLARQDHIEGRAPAATTIPIRERSA